MPRRASKKTIKKKLDKLVGAHCRSKGVCEARRYSGDQCSTKLEWCHIKSRRYLSVRWSPNNCVCMCSAHHRYFTANPDEFIEFLEQEFPHRLVALREEFLPSKPMKRWEMEELYNELTKKLDKV